MSRLTIAEAETQGLTVDRHCYPHIAYSGARFGNRGKKQPVLTELEAELLAACQRAVKEMDCPCGRPLLSKHEPGCPILALRCVIAKTRGES